MLNQVVGNALCLGAAVVVILTMSLGHLFVQSVVSAASFLVKVGHCVGGKDVSHGRMVGVWWREKSENIRVCFRKLGGRVSGRG
jgi:hypothetical protein